MRDISVLSLVSLACKLIPCLFLIEVQSSEEVSKLIWKIGWKRAYISGEGWKEAYKRNLHSLFKLADDGPTREALHARVNSDMYKRRGSESSDST